MNIAVGTMAGSPEYVLKVWNLVSYNYKFETKDVRTIKLGVDSVKYPYMLITEGFKMHFHVLSFYSKGRNEVIQFLIDPRKEIVVTLKNIDSGMAPVDYTFTLTSKFELFRAVTSNKKVYVYEYYGTIRSSDHSDFKLSNEPLLINSWNRNIGPFYPTVKRSEI
jgi:hypothetical protein